MDVRLVVGVALGLLGTYLVSSASVRSRRAGFVVYLVSNVIWSTYWLTVGELVPIVQYVLFSVLAIRGLINNRH